MYGASEYSCAGTGQMVYGASEYSCAGRGQMAYGASGYSSAGGREMAYGASGYTCAGSPLTDSGPVMLWSVMPMELVLEGLSPTLPTMRDVVVDGRLLQVEPGPDGRGTVVRLVSGRAQDYLDPRFQPGARVPLPVEG
ncbi:hypothetical protein J2Z79_001009 [Symbiobacterium terraclitae]|uniref:Uncharacterized protein n=2 Tax=Symbiobacterium terraclitae TaxID=557451 RepID=A0ABS4JQ10_9FIRM|nr:hypothetical protein [Symbiobacterium terraclitae]